MNPRTFVSRLRAAVAAAAAAWAGNAPGEVSTAAAATVRARPSPTAGLEQLLRLFKHSDSGLLVCHRDDRLVLGSPVAARLFGVEPPAMRGTPGPRARTAPSRRHHGRRQGRLLECLHERSAW